MVVRPKRADPISTRPIYLARLPSKDLPRWAATPSSGAIRIFLDMAVSIDAEALVARLKDETKHPLMVVGSITSALAGRPQTEARQAVSSLANALAWARIRDTSSQQYRVLPLRSEVDAEEALYKAQTQPRYEGVSHPLPTAGSIYDASAVQAAFAGLLNERRDIVITTRQFASWDNRAGKWTTVGIVRGSPAVISTATDGDDPSLLDALRRALS